MAGLLSQIPRSPPLLTTYLDLFYNQYTRTYLGLALYVFLALALYALIGVLYSTAQMTSYGVTTSLILLPVILLSGPLNLAKIVTAQALTI